MEKSLRNAAFPARLHESKRSQKGSPRTDCVMVSPTSECEVNSHHRGYGSRESILQPQEKDVWKRRRRVPRDR
ncbi:hypothetical protein N1851_027384 [Merluccius polli]|uniref:Uncharacterized protein n=1 Tax=Merluccius polli TaxID=89951 RepID=A0AA47MAG2_MERPO|nr:hypothetical protein N1851_027384 [Merluccius polli]